MKNIVILGGGTVGWLTALMTKEHYPSYNITLVENSEIGVLGAGEGTTPDIMNVFNSIRISLSDLIKHCNATIKIGNKFTDWCGDGSEYFLPFDIRYPELSLTDGVASTYVSYPFMTYCLANNRPLEEIMFTAKLAEQNKIPFVSNGLNSFKKLESIALHLDARKLASYLREVAEARGISRIDGNYVSSDLNQIGEITAINLQDGRKIDLDFIFDCSGFARLLIGQLFNTEWISYDKYFPQNTAVPFFIQHDNTNLKPYTKSRGMKYGWMWRVDVQERSGCGYVFDSTLITPDQALAEVEEVLGHSVVSPKTFHFKAGVFKTNIVKNCMAVGLSGGFIEPLEASAIWQNMSMLHEFLYGDGINQYDNKWFLKSIDQFYNTMNTEILEFIQGHYITPRADTEFWKKIRYDIPVLPTLEEKIEHLKEFNLLGIRNNDNFVGTPIWLTMVAGQKILDIGKIRRHKQFKKFHSDFEMLYNQLKNNINQACDHCVTHDEFIRSMKELK